MLRWNIKEDIIIATKTNGLSKIFNGRGIGVSHLERSLINSQNGVHLDLSDAIQNCEDVKPSPLFNSQNVIIK